MVVVLTAAGDSATGSPTTGDSATDDVDSKGACESDDDVYSKTGNSLTAVDIESLVLTVTVTSCTCSSDCDSESTLVLPSVRRVEVYGKITSDVCVDSVG